MSSYIELVFFGVNNFGIVRRISWSTWRLKANIRLIRSDGRIVFLYNSEDIKYYWRAFCRQSDSYDLPFTISKLCISLKHG